MISLSLYIHIPWCIKKCPYCDFNSHAISQHPDKNLENTYIDRLIKDLEAHQSELNDRAIQTIFIGGGTPSLFSGTAYTRLLQTIASRYCIAKDVEITLEANPGTVEQGHFDAYLNAGINRLSLGLQSFQDTALQKLGRIHSAEEGIAAVENARKAGFKRINIDLMYGLPNQSVKAALSELKQAIDLNTEHLSWYQLTIEPNTLFYRYQPKLPKEEIIIQMENEGIAMLKSAGITRYEISAFCRQEGYCSHNLNYWTYGDYLGIGAGSHSKLTHHDTHHIRRFWKNKMPANYLDEAKPFIAQEYLVSEEELPFEFMLNTLRLFQATTFEHFQRHTGLAPDVIQPILLKAHSLGWLEMDEKQFCPTPLGYRYLNNLVELFLPNSTL